MLSLIRVALIMVSLHSNKTQTKTTGLKEIWTKSYRQEQWFQMHAWDWRKQPLGEKWQSTSFLGTYPREANELSPQTETRNVSGSSTVSHCPQWRKLVIRSCLEEVQSHCCQWLEYTWWHGKAEQRATGNFLGDPDCSHSYTTVCTYQNHTSTWQE